MSKRTAILLLLVSIPLLSLAQQKPKFVYCDVIVGATDISSGNVTITVDFGQKMKFWDNRMKNAEGKPVRFNSLVDALNYMGKKGWEFVQSYPVQVNSYSSDYHFLMKKPFDELEDDAKKEYLKD